MVADRGELDQPGRDRALVEAHCRGDDDVFALIVKEHYAMLLAQAVRRLGNRTEAEDAVQEAFERAFRAVGRFGGEFRLAAWLSRIVSNVCADHGARRAAEQQLSGRLVSRAATVADASESASDPEVLRVVRAAIDALPHSQRNTFLLHELDGLSYPEVADQLGISEDNARARVHRARVTLRRTLDATRSALAGLIALPVGIKELTRQLAGRRGAAHPRAVSSPGTGTDRLPSGASALPALPSAAGQMATGPIGQIAVAVAAGPRGSLLAALAASLAAVTSVFAGPGLASSSTPSAVVSLVVPTTAPTPASTPTSPTGATATVPTPSDPTSAPSIADPNASWIAAGAGGGASSPADAAPVGTAPSQPCPWPATFDAGGPISGSVAAVLRTPDVDLTPTSSSPVLATSTTIYQTVEVGNADNATSVDLQAQVCLPPAEPVLLVALLGPGGEVQLSGRLVLTTGDGGDTRYIFRGTVSSSAASIPWNLPDHFVALVEVHQPANTVGLTVAFLGTPLSTPLTPPSTGAAPPAPSPIPSTPSSSPTTPTTAASSSTDPGGSSSDTSPDPTSTSTTSTTSSASGAP